MRNRKVTERSPVGERIKDIRKKKGWTQKELAEKMGISQETVSKWEAGERFVKAEDVILLAAVFGIDCHLLLTGGHREHMTVLSDLGLSDQAISALKNWAKNAREHPQYIAGLDIDESEEGESQTENIVTSREALNTINLFLTTTSGWRLLSLICRFCSADFSQPTLDGQLIEEIEFPNRSGSPEGTTRIETTLLRFATMKAIETELDYLREELIEEEEV